MTIALLVGVVGAIIAAPHALSLENQPPMVAAAVWLLALALRALVTVLAVMFLVLVLPDTAAFHPLLHWCWHAAVPLVEGRLGISGHAMGGAMVLLPACVVALSATSVVLGLWKAARAVRRLVQGGLSGGPRDSVIISDPSVLVAAAGLRRPQVVVSAGALTELDDAELFASLDHERGHIRRSHRWLLLAGEVCRALGRLYPGAGHAAGELAFHLERDADHFALGRRHEPAALASAICKAASGAAWPIPTTSLNGGGTARRVRQLLDGAPSRPASTGARALVLALAVTVLALVAALPAATMAAVNWEDSVPLVHHCEE